jgi:hypothetical protein
MFLINSSFSQFPSPVTNLIEVFTAIFDHFNTISIFNFIFNEAFFPYIFDLLGFDLLGLLVKFYLKYKDIITFFCFSFVLFLYGWILQHLLFYICLVKEN